MSSDDFPISDRSSTYLFSRINTQSPSPVAPVRKNKPKSETAYKIDENMAPDSNSIVVVDSSACATNQSTEKEDVINVPKNYVQMIVVKYEVESKEKHEPEKPKLGNHDAIIINPDNNSNTVSTSDKLENDKHQQNQPTECIVEGVKSQTNIDQEKDPVAPQTENVVKTRSKWKKDKSNIPLLHSKSEVSHRLEQLPLATLTKADSELSLNKRIKNPLELLEKENSALKKTLESERSAFREQRAAMEAAGRKERAEAKRKEAALESQLRAALKASGHGVPANVKASTPALEPTSSADAVRLSIALQASKAENKALQEKIQVILEGDKKKATELRSQHDGHQLQIQQMEKDFRLQTTKLLEEIKSKERQLEQARKGTKEKPSKSTPSSTTTSPKFSRRMAVADQLLTMETQISRLEHEIQKKDDIIHSLRTAKFRREKQMSTHRISKDNLLKDLFLDVDSAVSSAPTSLSPQPSPDLWSRALDENQENLLEAARKQIQDLEKALSISTENQRNAQLKASQLEEQLQDLREHADLLEFRCLELEDSNEKRKSIEGLMDSDSGCTSPEDQLKNSVSPQLRRSDSGYKSPTQRSRSPTLKNQRILKTPTMNIPENDSLDFIDGFGGKFLGESSQLGDIDAMLGNYIKSDDIRCQLEEILLKSTCKEDKQCLEKVLHFIWNLQALNSSYSDNHFSMIRGRRCFDESFKNDYEQNKTSKMIATVSPYTQTSNHRSNMNKSTTINDDCGIMNFLTDEEPKKIFYGLQESGIFEDVDWSSKETQTDWWDCICSEPEGDLATEVQRLNQIREQLEKSGAIKNNTRASKKSSQFPGRSDSELNENYIDFYEKRIYFLENKISIYESSDDVKEKKLAQRLQREIELQSKVKNLESDFKKLKKKYKALEEECCEYEEAENDIRLHCQELEAEFDLMTAKLREMDEQRICAKNEADCYRALVQEYEEKLRLQFDIENDFKEKLNFAYTWFGVASFWNLWKFIAMQNNASRLAVVKYTRGINADEETEKLRAKITTLNNLMTEQNAKLIKYMDECDTLTAKLKAAEKQKNFSLNNEALEDANKIESLLENEKLLKAEIAKMEMREVAFLETLATGDTMWNDMEQKYKQKIVELEERENELLEIVSKYENEKHKWKESNEPLQIKVRESEEMEIILESQIEKLKLESHSLFTQNQSLQDKIQGLHLEIVKQKADYQNREDDLLKEISKFKKDFREVQNELSEYNKFHCEMIKSHDLEVVKLKKELKKLSKEIMELEVTNGELKEEVYTLETQAKENVSAVDTIRKECEQKISAVIEELQTKTKEVSVLEKKLMEKRCFPSALDEMNSISNTIKNDKSVCFCKLLCNNTQTDNWKILNELKGLKPSELDLLITNLCILKNNNENNKNISNVKANINQITKNGNVNIKLRNDSSPKPKIKEKPPLLAQKPKIDKIKQFNSAASNNSIDKYSEELTNKLLIYFAKTNVNSPKEIKITNLQNNYLSSIEENKAKQELVSQITESVKNIIHKFISEKEKLQNNDESKQKNEVRRVQSQDKQQEVKNTEPYNISAKDLIASFNKSINVSDEVKMKNSQIDYVPPKGLVFDRISKLSQEVVRPQILLKRSVSMIECKPLSKHILASDL